VYDEIRVVVGDVFQDIDRWGRSSAPVAHQCDARVTLDFDRFWTDGCRANVGHSFPLAIFA
jgi:hypothetical protein